MQKDNAVTGFIKFDLTTGQGRDALLRAAKADLCYLAFQEIDNYFRQLERYKLQNENIKLQFDGVDVCDVNVTPENHQDIFNLIYGLRRKIGLIIQEEGIDIHEEGPF